MTTEQQQRKVFEEWADSMGYSTFQYKDPDEYVSDDTYTTWVAWQAASKELATATEQRDEARGQRDRLAEALRKAISWGDSASHHILHRQDINWTYLNEAKEALQSLNQPNEL